MTISDSQKTNIPVLFEIASEIKKLFDILIEPKEITNYSYFNLKKAPELLNIGYRKAFEISEREERQIMNKKR